MDVFGSDGTPYDNDSARRYRSVTGTVQPAGTSKRDSASNREIARRYFLR